MRRPSAGRLVPLLFLICLSLQLPGCFWAVKKSGPAARKLAPGVYAFLGAEGNANAGFILSEEGVVVVDSQMNEPLARQMLGAIRKRTEKPILYVINTHYHGDHTFANHVFSPSRGIIAHEKTLQYLREKGQEHMEAFKRFFDVEQAQGIRLTLPTQTFQERRTLEIGGREIRLLFVGEGHTDSDIVVHLPQEKILFAGDLVYVGRLPWLGDGDTQRWLETLQRLRSLDFETVVPGHGKVGGREDVRRFEGYLTDLRAAVFTALLHQVPLEEMKENIRLPRYREDLKYSEWLPIHIEQVYREIRQGQGP